ncbi:MAG: hypothetical protein K2X66_09255 [Cyanobacteria bacterium]|nr:hypothetical protein [Cyanobacteriota bacterium]
MNPLNHLITMPHRLALPSQKPLKFGIKDENGRIMETANEANIKRNSTQQVMNAFDDVFDRLPGKTESKATLREFFQVLATRNLLPEAEKAIYASQRAR